MAAHGGKLCTSVPVLYTTSTLVFVWFGFKNIPNSGKSVQSSDEILLDQFYIIEYLKGFIIAVWPKKCAKLSEDGNKNYENVRF